MKEFSLVGTLRAEAGKKAAKQLRKQGLVPCNLVSKEGAKAFAVKEEDLRNLLYTSQVYAVNLDIEGTACKAILKEVQFGPVSEEVLHVEFQQFDPAQPISVTIPIKLEGFAEGVKAGGKLVKQVRSLIVRGLYTDIPERLVIDVTPIELGKTLKVAALSFEGLEILTAKSVIVAAVKITRAARAK